MALKNGVIDFVVAQVDFSDLSTALHVLCSVFPFALYEILKTINKEDRLINKQCKKGFCVSLSVPHTLKAINY